MKNNKHNYNIVQIIKDYKSGISTSQISKNYNVHPTAINYLLRKQNIKIRSMSEASRTYRINYTYFDNINTKEKAYILGLLYADGCNSTEINTVRLLLTEQDKDLLLQISKIIFIDEKPLIFRRGGEFVYKSKKYLRKNSYCFTINNKHISDKLNKLGLIKNKSLTLEFPTWLCSSLYSHFIRGYFDGDGCISIDKKDKCKYQY